MPRIAVTFSLQEVEEIERDCAVYRGRLERIAKHSAVSREEQVLRRERSQNILLTSGRDVLCVFLFAAAKCCDVCLSADIWVATITSFDVLEQVLGNSLVSAAEQGTWETLSSHRKGFINS